ncbi:MAG: alpha/beta hydrolase [Rubinisphaera brasiliensis]|uniref:alpha/beta hydrolase n=1 Tax=Rubinisphaera brasiliensis TaxID=119 RepID=UPI00391CD1D8
MPLDDRARGLLETLEMLGTKPVNEMSVEEARARKVPVVGSNEVIAFSGNLELAGRNGLIPTRIYVPDLPDQHDLPIVAYIHGGGWVLGELDNYDQLCSALAARSECIVLSIGYRLAPEHPYPAGLHDCLDVVERLLEHPLESADDAAVAWSSSPENVVVMGDSAGGNLAAVTAQILAEQSEFSLRGQVLIYPITDSTFQQESYVSNGEGYMLTTAMMHWFWDHYCPNLADRESSTTAPMRFERPEILPPTFSLTCEYDPLRDEGNEYARFLENAGVPVDHVEVPGMLHGFVRYLNTFPQADEQLTEMASWIRQYVGVAAVGQRPS